MIAWPEMPFKRTGTGLVLVAEPVARQHRDFAPARRPGARHELLLVPPVCVVHGVVSVRLVVEASAADPGTSPDADYPSATPARQGAPSDAARSPVIGRGRR